MKTPLGMGLIPSDFDCIPTFAAASFHQPSDSGHVAKILQMLKSETTAHGKSANVNFSMLSSNIKDAELLQNFPKCFLFSAWRIKVFIFSQFFVQKWAIWEQNVFNNKVLYGSKENFPSVSAAASPSVYGLEPLDPSDIGKAAWPLFLTAKKIPFGQWESTSI